MTFAAALALEIAAEAECAARAETLRKEIVANERARAFYAADPGRNALRIRHCDQRIAAAREELATLDLLAAITAEHGAETLAAWDVAE